MVLAVLSGAGCWPFWCHGNSGPLQPGPLWSTAAEPPAALQPGALAGPKEGLQSSQRQIDTGQHIALPAHRVGATNFSPGMMACLALFLGVT